MLLTRQRQVSSPDRFPRTGSARRRVALAAILQPARRPPTLDVSPLNLGTRWCSTYVFRQLYIALGFLDRVFGSEKISNCEKEKKQLDGGADRVVLVTRSDIAEDDGGARYLLGLNRDISECQLQLRLQLIPVHDLIHIGERLGASLETTNECA